MAFSRPEYHQSDYAQRYDNRWAGTKAKRDKRKQVALRQALAALDVNPSGVTLLDIPCGTGRFAGFLTEMGISYVGADLAEAMVRVARAKHPDRHLVVADLTDVPCRDGAFDCSICIRLFHLVRERDVRLQFLRSLARVSRLGVILDYRQRESLRGFSCAMRSSLGIRRSTANHLQRADFEKELNEAGLEPIRWIPVRSPGWTTDKVVVACRVLRTQ